MTPEQVELACVRPIRHSHGELKGIILLLKLRTLAVRPIRHSHGELKGTVINSRKCRLGLSKTYSTFPRGIESFIKDGTGASVAPVK